MLAARNACSSAVWTTRVSVSDARASRPPRQSSSTDLCWASHDFVTRLSSWWSSWASRSSPSQPRSVAHSRSRASCTRSTVARSPSPRTATRRTGEAGRGTGMTFQAGAPGVLPERRNSSASAFACACSSASPPAAASASRRDRTRRVSRPCGCSSTSATSKLRICASSNSFSSEASNVSALRVSALPTPPSAVYPRRVKTRPGSASTSACKT
jgi:hypothetical protein